MVARKCRDGPRTSPERRRIGRVRLLVLAGLTLSWPAARAQTGILPPDAAAKEYLAGRDAVRARDWDAAVRHLSAALATGHKKPAERLGTNRYPVERYDPDYWLGVAYMERGDDAKARQHLETSSRSPLIARWPEFADLTRRLSELARREEIRRVPTPAPARATPTSSPSPSPTPSPTPSPAPTPTPDGVRLLAPVASPSPVPSHSPVRAVASLEPTEELTAAITAAAAAQWDEASGWLRKAREKSPGAPSVDLLQAFVDGSRFVVEGRKDPKLRERARRALADFRARGGSRKAEETWISPALRAALSR